MTVKCAIVCGAGGFIGHHLVTRLKQEGYWVRGVDLKINEFQASCADDFVMGDLRDPTICQALFDRPIDEVYQLAADMGGAGFIFTGENDANIMHNSALINLNMVECCREHGVQKVFYSSSACIYPEHNQLDPDNPMTAEASAYPAAPDSEYGWEKLLSERLYMVYARCHQMDIKIARFHNVFGPYGTWQGGREKAPAALCRKVAMVPEGGSIDIWGDGEQTRSFLYIDEAVEGVRRLMESSVQGPINIGSSEMVSINALALMIAKIANKTLELRHIEGPLGVRGRTSNNQLIQASLGWAPSAPLCDGLSITYQWIASQVYAV